MNRVAVEVIGMIAAVWLMLSGLLYALQLQTGSFPKPLAAKGDLDARNVLIERNLRLVAHITPMGSVASFAPGKTLYIRVGEFHKAHRKSDTVYSFRLYTEKGLAYCREFNGSPMQIAFSVEKRMFYRAEIFNESDGHTEALTNPIWLE